MTDKYKMQRVFRDDATRLVIPNIRITTIDAITNIISSYITNPVRNSSGFFSSKDKFGNKINLFTNLDGGTKSIMTSIIDALVIGLGVTKITSSQEYTMPFSKGIGSTGEVIHLLGAKNEIINIEFKTDRYPGRLGYVLRALFQKVLESTQVVYLIDDLFLATPCLVRKTKIYKEGTYRGAIMGELELVSLTTGGSFMDDTLGGKDKVKGYAGNLKKSVLGRWGVLSDRTQAGLVSVGAIAVLFSLLSGIAGYGS